METVVPNTLTSTFFSAPPSFLSSHLNIGTRQAVNTGPTTCAGIACLASFAFASTSSSPPTPSSQYQARHAGIAFLAGFAFPPTSLAAPIPANSPHLTQHPSWHHVAPPHCLSSHTIPRADSQASPHLARRLMPMLQRVCHARAWCWCHAQPPQASLARYLTWNAGTGSTCRHCLCRCHALCTCVWYRFSKGLKNPACGMSQG